MIVSTPFVRAAVLLGLALAATPALAQRSLLPPAPGDLVVAQALPAAERSVQLELESAPVEFFQPLAADQRLAPPAPFLAESREYWLSVDADALSDGFPLALTAPGAVVLLSPTTSAEPLLREQAAIVRAGTALPLDAAADTLVDAEALRAAGMDAVPGSLGFRLRDGFERDAELAVSGARGRYVLHVLEPNSPHRATAQAAADNVHVGGEVTIRASLLGGGSLDAASGLLLAPDGRSFDLDFRVRGHEAVAVFIVPADTATGPGLWDARVQLAGLDGERAFQRDVRTALALVAPTARLAGPVSVNVRRHDQALLLGVDVEVASSGRYELRGTLYGTDAAGASVPIGLAQYAVRLEPGAGTLTLAFQVPAQGEVGGPYQLRDLRLSDQGRMGLLERRALALRID